MARAVEEFFPDSKILDDGTVVVQEGSGDLEKRQEREEGDSYALRRVDTGLSSIVGSRNGDRPGGFVLVVDGYALEYVCFHTLFNHVGGN
jgi:phospholipid-translocating ATPase